MENDDLIEVVTKVVTAIVVLALQFAWSRKKKRTTTAEEPPESPEVGPDDTYAPPEPTAHLRLESLRHSANKLKRGIDLLPKHTHILKEVLDETLRIEDPAPHSGDGHTAPTQRPLELAALRIEVIRELVQMRQHPGVGSHLADAETLAESFLTPFRDLSRVSSRFNFAEHHPICVPTQPNYEAILLDLLPTGYPLVFVPRDFGTNLHRWSSVAHEMGHLVWYRVEGFSSEVTKQFSLDRTGVLPTGNEDGEVDLDVYEPFAAWLPEIIADTFALMMVGPAALRSFIACFAEPRDPDTVCWAGANGSYFSPHPPSHLRVLMGAKLLTHMGFDVEVRSLVSHWNDMHKHPEHLFVPGIVPGAGRFGLSIPVQTLQNIGEQLVVDIYRRSWDSLDGREFRSIHGVLLTPGLWAQALRLKEPLLKGEPVNEDPRLVVVAALEALGQDPSAQATLRSAVMQSILGRGTEEKRPNVDPWSTAAESSATPGTDRTINAQDIRAAIVLRELLPRRRPRSLR